MKVDILAFGWMISTHALREEGDTIVRRVRSPKWHFYPRPPRGGRRAKYCPACRPVMISTHALREEGDGSTSKNLCFSLLFLPTPSARRATVGVSVIQRVKAISTHALREEGDRVCVRFVSFKLYFYPRPPRGGRLVLSLSLSPLMEFLPTPSARRATRTGFATAPLI